jgi:hypothetical protein
MSKKTLGLIIVLLILTIVLVFVALSTKQQQSQTTTTPGATAKPSNTPTPVAGHTILSMSPNPVTAGRGVPSTVNVMIDTQGDSVRAIQLEIAYDPKALTNVTIKPGDFFPGAQALPVGGVNQTTGRITFAVTPANLRDAKSGKGTVATLTFYPTAAAATSTAITLLDKSLVTSPGLGAQTVLKSVSGTSVVISGTQTSLTSTPAVTSPVPTQ